MPEHGFILQNDNLLLLHGRTLPSGTSLKSHFIRHYPMGEFNSISCYCAEISVDAKLPEDLQPAPFRKALEILGKNWFTAATKAISIIAWDKNHQFCGRCSEKTIYKSSAFERVCTHCGLSFYPRISPSIIVLIKKDDSILMSRSHHFVKGAWGLIAGFVEVGESMEDAVHREVSEEVGIRIKNLRYFGSQFWPFPDSMMIAFTADYASGELRIDSSELESADWYRHDNLPGGPSYSLSIAKKLIDHFIAEQKQSS